MYKRYFMFSIVYIYIMLSILFYIFYISDIMKIYDFIDKIYFFWGLKLLKNIVFLFLCIYFPLWIKELYIIIGRRNSEKVFQSFNNKNITYLRLFIILCGVFIIINDIYNIVYIVKLL
jgi:hypothetical protein